MKYPDPRTFFSQYLQKHHLRLTPERFEVLDSIVTRTGHFDADSLFASMRSSGSTVSRATVYNTLERLTECGIVARSRFSSQQARYELMFGTEHHHHIHCELCGAVEEFIDRRVERVARDASASLGFKMHDAALHIIGVCSKCAGSAGEMR